MNPFSYGTVVKEPYFFDRKEERERIVSTLAGGNNLVLYAPRRYGKTSLVMKVIEDLNALGYTSVYFDFMTVYSRESFIEVYSKAVFSKQGNAGKAIETIAKLVKGIRPKLTFDQNGAPEFSIEFTENKISDKTIDDIVDLPEKLSSEQKKYIIVMDEFQDIDKLNGENFEKLLRSKIQHHTNVNYLFLGSRTHILQDMFNNKRRAFYNSTFALNLNPLPEDETINFLIERYSLSGIKIEKGTASYLIEQAGNIPYYIQFLAAEIWQQTINLNKVIDKEIVRNCANKIIDLKSDYYFELFDRQTAYQKKLLKAIAISNQNIYSTDYALKFRLSAVSTTQKAISGLISDGILEKTEREFSFGDPFFRRYILHYA
jgi:uncharacterized protein